MSFLMNVPLLFFMFLVFAAKLPDSQLAVQQKCWQQRCLGMKLSGTPSVFKYPDGVKRHNHVAERE